MAKTILKDTHLLLDLGTHGRLKDIAAWSEEALGTSKTVRAMTRRFHALLSKQMVAESASHAIYVVEVDAAGAEVVREKLNLKL